MSVIEAGFLRSSDLCQPCLSYLEAILLRHSYGQLFTYPQLLNRESCLLCRSLEHQLLPEQMNRIAGEKSFALEWSYWGNSKSFSVRVRSDDMQELGFLTLEPSTIKARSVKVTNRSRDSLHLALSWLNDCLQHHRSCGLVEFKHCSARRLVSVGSNDGPCALRLVNAAQIPAGEVYATLSHCWGPVQIFKLLQGNLQSLMQEIPRSSLPKVFQDAIDVVQQAKVRYLWIDSLCIVQDCPVDWESESQKMGDIYSNALFNISATGFEDGSVGLFVERDAELLKTIKVSTSVDIPLRDMVLSHGQYEIVDRLIWEDGVESAPLHRRAWVAQERMLARRILHFGARQLFWECSESHICESFPNGILGFVDPGSIKGSAYSQLSKGWPVHEYLRYWIRAVQLYSRGRLTLDSDKMTAIAGLARKLQEASNGLLGAYLAGLWRQNLVAQLTWAVIEGRANPRPTSYRCPSWSWLGTDSSVAFLGLNSEVAFLDLAGGKENIYVASILECVTRFPSDNEFGLLRGGHLTILCLVLCVELTDHQEHSVARDDGRCWLCPADDMVLLLDFLTDTQAKDSSPTTSSASRYQNPKLWWTLARPLEIQSKRPEYFYLAVLNHNQKQTILGLVLKPAGLDQGKFQRLGVFTWSATSPEKLQANLNALYTATQNLPVPLCGTRKPDGRYQITIV